MSFAIGNYSPQASVMAGLSVPSSAGPAAADASAAGRNSGADKAVSDFLAYAKETPAQRMREAILKSMGLSEDDLKSMGPEKRKAVEETIQQKIKQALEEAAAKGKKGLVADVTA